jgi:alpha-mannosidase
VTDKASGAQVNRVNVYEDVMDIGDEYMFAAAGETPITTAGCAAKVALESVSPFEAVFVIDQSLTVPAGYDRKNGCALAESKTMAIRTRVAVSSVSRAVDIRTEIDNCAENHRLRALFPNTVKTDKVYAHGQFDIVERNIQTGPRWKNPNNEQRMQAFVELRDEQQAFLVAGHGLHEYEVSRDGSNALALTILRAVDILGDWGDFPTPEAQCQGTCVAEYAIQVGAAAEHCRMEQEALEYYAGPMPVVQVQSGQTGTIRPDSGLVTLEGSGVWCTALKCEERGSDVVLRLYNTQSTATEVTLHTDSRVKGVTAANLAEKREGEELLQNGSATLTFRPKEIRTLILSVSE